MADDELMDDSDLEESNREDEKVFSIFDDTHATQYITGDGKNDGAANGARRIFRFGTLLRHSSILQNNLNVISLLVRVELTKNR